MSLLQQQQQINLEIGAAKRVRVWVESMQIKPSV